MQVRAFARISRLGLIVFHEKTEEFFLHFKTRAFSIYINDKYYWVVREVRVD